MIRLISAVILASTLIAPSWVASATCENDPNECTPKNLCEMTTEIQGGEKVWSSNSKLSKHISFAKQLGMDCGASDPKDPCDLDANECKISELCERATTGEDNKQWNLDNPDHVRLAKEYSLSCEVSDEKKIENDNTCTYGKQQNCNKEELCLRASWAHSETGVRSWYSDNNVFVIEAKQRNLDCGVTEPLEQSKTCSASTPEACGTTQLCQLATTKRSGVLTWTSPNSSFKKEAVKRGLDCGVNSSKAYCGPNNPQVCGDIDLCSLASTYFNFDKRQIFKNEAKQRGLTCDPSEISSANKSKNDEVKQYQRFNFSGKRKGEVSIGVVDQGWNGERLYSWPNGAALYLSDWKDDKSYNSNSNTNEVFPELRLSFIQLPKSSRINIQRNLQHKRMYQGSLDGLWGRNTLLGLVEYSSKKFLTISFDNPTVVNEVIKQIQNDPFPSTTVARSYVLASLHKALQDQKNIQNKSPAFKSSFLNQSQLKRKQIQYALNKLGYYRSGIDGLWGNGTKNALTSFASAEGLGTSTPSTIFSRLLSKVSVPSSFAAPKKNNYSNNKRSNNQGLTPIISNPPMSASQALAVCEPQAKLAGSRAARAYQSPSYGSSINCNTFGSITNCRSSRSGGGGVLGGIAEGLGAVRVGKREQAAVLSSCLAQYGWRK